MNETSAAALTAAQVMSTPVVAVTVDHSLAAAWEAMRHRGVHHVVVLDSAGIATVLDDRTVLAEWPAGGPDAPSRRRIGDVVEPFRRGARCVLPDDRLTTVARAMIEAGCDAVPVVTPTGSLVGLVTATDLVAVLASVPDDRTAVTR